MNNMGYKWYKYKGELVRIEDSEKAPRKGYVVVVDILGVHREVKKRKLKTT